MISASFLESLRVRRVVFAFTLLVFVAALAAFVRTAVVRDPCPGHAHAISAPDLVERAWSLPTTGQWVEEPGHGPGLFEKPGRAFENGPFRVVKLSSDWGGEHSSTLTLEARDDSWPSILLVDDPVSDRTYELRAAPDQKRQLFIYGSPGSEWSMQRSGLPGVPLPVGPKGIFRAIAFDVEHHPAGHYSAGRVVKLGAMAPILFAAAFGLRRLSRFIGRNGFLDWRPGMIEHEFIRPNDGSAWVYAVASRFAHGSKVIYLSPAPAHPDYRQGAQLKTSAVRLGTPGAVKLRTIGWLAFTVVSSIVVVLIYCV